MPDDEIIWATSTTGDDFQCVHVDAWMEAKARIADLEALAVAMQRAVPGGSVVDTQWMADELRRLATAAGVKIPD